MNKQALIEQLYEEMRVAEEDIADMIDIITDIQMDIAYARGRRCLACCILSQLEGDDE